MDEDLSTWSVDRLAVFGEVEQVREVAQGRAYSPEAPADLRLRWARLSLDANARLPGDGPWDRASRACQDLRLRTWVIEHLRPVAEPDLTAESVARDTLAALTLDPGQARALAAHWRDLPVEQIGELRRHKNLTGHLDRLLPLLPPGPSRDRLIPWLSVRDDLP